MELIRYMMTNISRRPMRALFIAAAGFISSLVLVFAFALGARVTKDIRADTIAKWTGNLWISTDTEFKFDEGKTDSYKKETLAVKAYLKALPSGAVAVPWATGFCEMQAGTARTYVNIEATDFSIDKPYRDASELVAGTFPGPKDEYGILVTVSLAKKYNLKPGDSVMLFIPSVYGARNVMDFTVTGIVYASAPWYDTTISLRTEDYMSMSEREGLFPYYKVYLEDETRIAPIVSSISALAPDFKAKGYRDDAFVRFLLSLGTTDIALLGTMAMIIFLALLIGINSIILTNIFDRRDEIGTLRALGFPKGIVRNLFFFESVLSLLAGYVGGVAVVAAVAVYYNVIIVRPPLLMLQYALGMTRMRLDLNAATALIPFVILFALLTVSTYRTIGIETEKQAVTQMANR